MPASPRPFTPDYAVPPGEIIAEHLEELGISGRELARRTGRSPKLIAEIISGKAALEPETALQIERVIKLEASILLGMESRYRLHLAREQNRRQFEDRAAWLRSFPLKGLEQSGCFRREGSTADQVEQVLRFFRAGSPEACEARFDELLSADYRTSPSFDNKIPSLAAWLQLGEIQAAELDVEDYNRGKFLEVLEEIRKLTRCPVHEALACAIDLCASAGVALVVEQPFEGVRASGVSRWLAPGRPLIQQSFRYHSNDHFWFTFFHECAHILLHSRKATFVDVLRGRGSGDSELEEEANAWASDFLIPQAALLAFVRRFSFKEQEVVDFAREHQVAPGIVVGQLQHMKVIKFSHMRALREIYDDCEISAMCVSQREAKT